MNALKHGFTAEVKLLPGESQEAFDRLLAGYLERLQPADTFESSIVEHIVTIEWQMRRIRTVEACLVEMESHHPDIDRKFAEITGHYRNAVAYERISQRGVFQLANRQLARLSREFNRLVRMFYDLRQVSPPAPQTSSPVETASPEPAPEPQQQKEQNEATAPPPAQSHFAWKPLIRKVFTSAPAPPLVATAAA